MPGSQRHNLVWGALPCQCHFAPVRHLSGDTSQRLANAVLLGDRSVASRIISFLLGPLALGRGSSDDGAVALQWQAPVCLVRPEWCETLPKLELLIDVLDTDTRI